MVLIDKLDEKDKKKKIFFRISEEQDKYVVPFSKSSKMYNDIVINKLTKKLDKQDIRNVVLSNQLKTEVNLRLGLADKNIHILDGKILMHYLTTEIIEYIYINMKKDISEGKISVLVNNLDETITKEIIELAPKVKRLNVVSNHLEKFKKIEEILYNNFGIVISCSNNRKTSLIKADIIINFDFVEEAINSYKLSNNAVIVNVLDTINIKSKKFCGINISNFKIEGTNLNEPDGFFKEEIYEANLLSLKNYEKIKEKIKKDNIKITRLIGSNGPIINEEYINIL